MISDRVIGDGKYNLDMNEKTFVAFDQYQRYETISRLIRMQCPKGFPDNLQLLELGASSHKDMRFFLPNVKIVYSDVELTSEMENDPDFQKVDGTALAFEDNSFDYIYAADVLEHVPNEKRKDFLSEACRVAKRSVILSFPYDSQDIIDAEARVNAYHKAITGQDFIWLKEHSMYRWPGLGDVDKILKSLGVEFTYFFHGDIMTWEKMWYCHFDTIYSPNADEYRRCIDHYYNRHLYESDVSESCYRVFYVISQADKQCTSIKWKEINLRASMFLDALLSRQKSMHYLQKGLQLDQRLRMIDSSQRQLREAERAIACKDKQIETARQVLDQKDTQINEARDSLMALEAQLKTVRHVIAGKDTQIQSASALISDLERQVADAGTVIEDQKKQLESVRQLIAEKDSQIQSAGAVIDDLEEQAADADTAIEDQKKQLESAQQLIARKDGQIQSAGAVINDLKGQIADAGAVIKDQKKQLESAQQIIARKDGQIQSAGAVINDLKRQIADAGAVIEDQKKQLESAQQIIAEKDGQIQAASVVISDLNGQIANVGVVTEDQKKRRRISKFSHLEK